MWLTSAATPGAPRISYKLSDVTSGLSLRRRERGWPMPPPAPRTATFVWRAADEEKLRDWVRARRAERANMVVVVEVGVEVGGKERLDRERMRSHGPYIHSEQLGPSAA